MTNNIQIAYDRFIRRICKVGYIDSLQTIWGYIRNLQFNKEIPFDIETPPKYNLSTDPDYKRSVGIGEWEFDIILLYVILYSPKETSPLYSLKKFNYMSLVVNDIRLIRDEIDKSIIPKKEDVFKEFFRIMHRQFIWQQPINRSNTFRFYKIFSHPFLKDLIKKNTNLDLKDLYRTGLLFTGYFINHFSCSIPLKSEVPWFTEEMFYSFLNFFGISTQDFVNKYKEKFTIDEAFLYRYNPLRSFPLLIHGDLIYCPIPIYIMWKITNGIYYDIVNERGFDNAFGKAFEEYCGFVFYKVLVNRTIQIIPEITYGKSHKKSSDWILFEDNTFIFIECKAKRLRLESITRFNDNQDLDSDIKKMIGFIFQAYKSINDAINKNIPKISISDNTEICIIILTLDNWHLGLDPYLNKQIRNDLESKFEAEGIDKAILDKYPFHIRSIGLFENDCQLINAFGLRAFHQKMNTNSLSDLSENFKYEDIFASEMDVELFSGI
jgi:hypothetical protein